MVVSNLYSQDIIVTTDSQKIDAKIIEVTESEIKYKEKDNPNGPTFVLQTSDINSVIFANGKVAIYNEDFDDEGEMDEDESEEVNEDNNKYVSRYGNKYYYDGMVMYEDDFAYFLLNNCPEAYDQFHNGQVISSVGWIFFSIGVGLDLGTCIGYLVSGMSSATTPLALVGLGFEIACIPTLCVGYAKKHRSADMFNSLCVKKSKPYAYWSINASQNGIGLAFNF